MEIENLNQNGIDNFGRWLSDFHKNAKAAEVDNRSTLFSDLLKSNTDLSQLVKDLEKENNYLQNKLKELENNR